jgi:hypothetical protein
MATARSTQAHQKRVQKIAEDAASAIAAVSPVEEEVVVVVEETPIEESAPGARSRSAQVANEGVATMAGFVGQAQQAMADSITRWIDMTSGSRGAMPSMDSFGGVLDARRLTEESFRFWEELLASQKQFALRFVDAITPAKAA